jgi:thioredoxin-like negative regulator of GroEL
MLYLVLVVALITAAGTTPTSTSHNYAEAYRKSQVEGKPLMVIVSATWCPACHTLKDTTIRDLETSGQLSEVNLAVVDRDVEPELAKELMREEKIPQIIVYSKSTTGRWERSQLIGYQPQGPVRSLIRSAVNLLRRS